MKPSPLIFLTLLPGLVCSDLSAVIYEVGPARTFSALAQVPWEKLQPGDTVLIHARPEPYREKFVLCRAGTAEQPITVRGVPDAAGRLPVIDGDGATTPPRLKFWGEVRSVIKIGGAKNPPDLMPRHLVIENLEVRSARPPYQFTDAEGHRQSYVKNAASIHVEKAEHLIIRHCILHDSGNGLFVSSNDERASRDILVESNYIHGNGNPNSGQEHNVYSAAVGIVFQFNHFGPLRETCLGGNIKDRSAGLVIRANWIEGGNKELDLVDAQDSGIIRRDPAYREAWVTENIFLKLPADRHSTLVHYGGDSSTLANYRRGVLHFYHNTVITYRADPTVLFWLSSNDERCDFRNNLMVLAPPKAGGKVKAKSKTKAMFVLAQTSGTFDLSHNWFPAGWQAGVAVKSYGVVHDDGTSLVGGDPGLADVAAQDFRLTARSPCRNAGQKLPTAATAPDDHPQEYVKHQSGRKRFNDGQPDVGAFEFSDR